VASCYCCVRRPCLLFSIHLTCACSILLTVILIWQSAVHITDIVKLTVTYCIVAWTVELDQSSSYGFPSNVRVRFMKISSATSYFVFSSTLYAVIIFACDVASLTNYNMNVLNVRWLVIDFCCLTVNWIMIKLHLCIFVRHAVTCRLSWQLRFCSNYISSCTLLVVDCLFCIGNN